MNVKFFKAQLSKIKFTTGLNPHIEKIKSQNSRSIPDNYQAVCLISADFELAWASRYTKSVTDPLQKAVHDGLQTRKNVPKILDICDQYHIPITWATVGHLFLERCQPVNGIKHPDLPRLSHFENQYWKFRGDDWFEYDPCTDYRTDPAWYAPDLIRDILARKAKHEIGCHTFSHVDCRDDLGADQVFESEIRKCIGIASDWGLELKSFVHPGHTIGNLKQLERFGFTSFRTNYRDTLALPVKHYGQLWEFKNTAELSWRQGWSVEYHTYRYKKIIDRAIRHKKLCVLWFHPSFDSRVAEAVLPALLTHLNHKRDQVLITSHAKYADWLNSGSREFYDQ